MRIRPLPLLTCLVILSASLRAQDNSDYNVLLRTGTVQPEKNIDAASLERFNNDLRWVNNKSAAVFQFQQIPTASQRAELENSGLKLLDYIPRNAYIVGIHQKPDLALLQRAGVVSVFQLTPAQKLQPSLVAGNIPSWARKSPGKIELWIQWVETFSFEEIKKEFASKGVEISNDDYISYQVLGVIIPQNRLEELASYPFIQYVQPAPHGDQLLNFVSRTNSKGNVLSAASGVGGFDLTGENVVIGVGDDADVQYHVDFRGRLINRAGAGNFYHGNHVTGTVAGAGNVNELFKGYAPRSTIVSQLTSGIISNASTYVTDHNMVITNNSYGDIVGDCDYAGTYDLLSRILDQQATSLVHLQHVFAGGNDGSATCAPYPAGFHTILGAYQSSKNTLVVGATESTGAASSFSSRGPVNDGRIRPDIMAYGRFSISTVPNNTYGFSSGTSMASPAVAGGLGLLYQRYRQLNAGANPKSGLMKALICNGGYDLGNTGADFIYGYGWMNLLRSADMLNNTRYFISTVNNGGSNTHTITVPANTAQLKAMLYWHDPAASVLANPTLVNDLDLEITDPSAVINYPWRLDTVPANVNNPATTGADHINNMEQVVITNPAAGNYTITIKGTAVTQSPPQEYFVVYDFIPVSTQISFPLGGEALNPGETVLIQWESYGDPANTFTVEYSINNGSTWTVINNNVAANLRQLSWTVPNVQTDQALVRVTRNSTALVSTSQAFTILGIPTASLATTQCEGYIALNWTSVTGATDYEVFRLIGNEMTPVATTASTSYIFSGLSPDTTYWVSVRARLNGNPGRRADAISRRPNSGTCAGTISDNDLRMEAITGPASGRIATSTALTTTTSISGRFKNLDDAAITSFDIRYSVNGGAWTTETVNTTVAAGATYTHTFTATYDFSAAGNYELRIEVINLSGVDPVSANNIITDTIKQIANNLIVLPFSDDLESASAASYYKNYTGVNGIERYDYSKTFTQGRLSTYLNSGMAYSGTKSLLLDLDGYDPGGNSNFVTGTYNLTGINAATQDIRLDFQYKQHGDSVPHANNTIWIRGNDTQPWISAFTLSANENEPGVFKKSPSIEVSDLLIANGQNFSSSFQVRFGQFGYVRISDNFGFHGNSFDDIRLYEATDDVQMISIDTPIVNSCGLSSAVPVRISVRNSSSSTITNIPVQLIIDGGAPIIENIPSIGPDATVTYTFTATADLSAIGSHTLEIELQYPTDNFPDNDTLSVTVINAAIINTFPYLQNFESTAGGWYSSGKNDSWQYGTPASTRISTAASGIRAWKTNLAGNYNNRETSYLYSPCFDISGMTVPTLSFSTALDLEDCGGTFCDGAYLEYSADGITWTRLGSVGAGTNWYNKNYGGSHMWSVEDYTRWHVATIPLPAGISNLRLRFVVSSDPFVTREGIAVDDIHIYDNTMGIYDGITMGSPVNQNITGGTAWIDFVSGGKLVASINPNNQNMGSTNVQAFINTGSVRNDGLQYYHDRNITIKPATTSLADSAVVRFYFLDSETEALLNATGCLSCTKPSMAYELGVSKFSHTDDNLENGSISDNIGGNWLFITSGNVTKVPFDKGYYAEFRVKDFSEFWLNNGGPDNQTPLPVEILSFTVKKKNGIDVLAEWKTASEYNVSHYEIEVARGNSNYQAGRFTKIGSVRSKGNSASGYSYTFTDAEPAKYGTRYYRLKIVDRDGSVGYSAVRPLVFASDVRWEITPNPSDGIFSLVYQLNAGEQVVISVYNTEGKRVKQQKQTGAGFVSKTDIDLRSNEFSSGIYLIRVVAGEQEQTFKVIKQ